MPRVKDSKEYLDSAENFLRKHCGDMSPLTITREAYRLPQHHNLFVEFIAVRLTNKKIISFVTCAPILGNKIYFFYTSDSYRNHVWIPFQANVAVIELRKYVKLLKYGV